MLDKLLTTSGILLALGYVALMLAEGLMAIFIAVLIALPVIAVIRKNFDDSSFLVRLFIAAVVARMSLSAVIYVYELYEFFGPDALTYDFGGKVWAQHWQGLITSIPPYAERLFSFETVGWGMYRIVGFVYFLAGESILYGQTVSAVAAAAVVPGVYSLANRTYGNKLVARSAAVGVAFFPALIVWSSQMLKDGLMAMLVVVAIVMILRLLDRVDYLSVILLAASLFAVYSLRFYVFYALLATIVGSFIVGARTTTVSVPARLAAVVLIGAVLAFAGVLGSTTREIERFGSFERLETARRGAAMSAESGYVDKDTDVSTASGALVALPIGMAYLMLAPFPWQVTNFRQAVTLPEVFLWWSCIPLIIVGLLYTVRNKLGQAAPILIFTLLLSVGYSISQGNVGTAYRQRTQIQVFLLIFAAVGLTVWKEKRADRRLIGKRRGIPSRFPKSTRAGAS